MSGINANRFGESNNYSTGVAAGSSCTIAANFSPVMAGSYTAEITIVDSASPSTQIVTLGGTAPPVLVNVSPAVATLGIGQTVQLAAIVNNASNQSVTWSMSPAGAGSISTSGLYTAPPSITAAQVVTVTATSLADATASSSAVVTLKPTVAVSVSPTTATLSSGQTTQLAAIVSNASNQSVTWSMSPAGAGSISTSGLYTAPPSITAAQVVTVTATSLADATASSSAVVTLKPTVAVSVSPTTATLSSGQTTQLAAIVSNASNQSVTWSMSPAGAGSISTSGLYTAPGTIGGAQFVTVTATSQADFTAFSSAVITLKPTVAVSVSPTTATLSSGQTTQLAAIVSNASNQSVTWTMSPAGVGSVSASGLYTAPGTIGGAQFVTVTATSQADFTASSSTIITLKPTVAVSVSPTTATLSSGQTAQLAAIVSNTSDQTVTWSMSPARWARSALQAYTWARQRLRPRKR